MYCTIEKMKFYTETESYRILRRERIQDYFNVTVTLLLIQYSPGNLKSLVKFSFTGVIGE